MNKIMKLREEYCNFHKDEEVEVVKTSYNRVTHETLAVIKSLEDKNKTGIIYQYRLIEV